MSTAAPTPEPVHTGNLLLPTPEQLPDDYAILKRMILELLSTLKREQHDKQELRDRLDLLLRRLYGPKSERFNPDQLLLFEEPAADQSSAANEPAPTPAEPTPKRNTKPHGRKPLPKDLPRRPVHHELSESERLCVCGQLRIDIGTDMSEQLDYQPASLFVWQHWIHKYLCPQCAERQQQADAVAPAVDTMPITPSETMCIVAPTLPRGPAILSAPKPQQPIAKGLPGPGLLAQVIVSKYFDHLPLHRQEFIFARQGVDIARSTTCDWMAACAELLRPLYDRMVSRVLQSQWLHTDDTLIKNLDHAPGTTDKARFWAYLGDRAHPYNVFDFTLNRQRDGPQQFLKDYRGYLHADAFSGYDRLYLPDPRDGIAPILEVACNAHARRKFYDARGSDAARSHQALAYYAQLYELERRAKDNDFGDAARLQMRQELAVPVLDKFQTWLKEQRDQVLPRSPMSEAFGYALNNWTALCRYTEAGFLAIDNNAAEREMKRIAIGRKNYLFVGSEKGGRTAAVLYSFTSTCHRLNVEPWAYLQDALKRLPHTPPEQLAELLPDRWQATRAVAPTSPPPPTSAVGHADTPA
ncbi:MAG TPA: IS66 family transposase [Gemmataceae bacterium]|nr:IS66 family transposase [Gemmataceae bacterium]